MTEADGKPRASTGHARAICVAPPPWDIRQRVEHRGAHQGRFHSPHLFSEVRVRRKGPGAHGPGRPGAGRGGQGGLSGLAQKGASAGAAAGTGRKVQAGAGAGAGRD